MNRLSARESPRRDSLGKHRRQVAALAENGLDGLEKARQCRPRLVISDIRMPRLDGLEMAEQLTKLCPGVKIVLLTGIKSLNTPRELFLLESAIIF